LKTAYYACVSGALGPHTGASFVDALLERTSDSFNYIVLPEHCAADFDHPIRCIIDATRSSYPQLANFTDVEALAAIATRSGLDNTKKYISSKLRTAVFNHVLVHLHRRVRASMHSRKIDDDTEVEGMMEMFISGSTKRNVTIPDRQTVVGLRSIFFLSSKGKAKTNTKEKEDGEEEEEEEKKEKKKDAWEKAATEGVPVPPIDTDGKPSIEKVMLHLECCTLAEGTDGDFSPFPNAALGRCYQRLDTQLAKLILGVGGLTFHLGHQASKACGKTTRKARRVKGRQREPGKQGKRNGHFYLGTREKSALVSSIETDGVGVSIVVATEVPMRKFKTVHEPRTEAEKREYAKEKRRQEV